MSKPKTIIEALTQYFITCPLLKDGAFRIDYLGEQPVEYDLEVMSCDPVVMWYVNGDSERQYLFAFGSRNFYSQDRMQNIENSGFYERLADWVETNSKQGVLPDLPDGKEAEALEVMSSGTLFGEDKKTARYQIQLRLNYFQEG